MAKQNFKDVSKVGQPLKGINQDTSPQLQLDGTYRFALNAVNISEEGNQGYTITEEGNYLCLDLGEYSSTGTSGPLPWRVIGHIYTSDDEIILFLATDRPDTNFNFNAAFFHVSRIISLNTKTCEQTVFLTSACLDFRIAHPIQATYRIRNGCERNIYFTDDYNPPRQLNLDSLDQYLLPGQIYSALDPDNPVGSGNDIWDCNQMKIFPEAQVPCLEYLETLDSGGIDVLAGVYQFSIQYLDEDLNPTNWFNVSNPVPVYSDNQDAGTDRRYDIQGNPTGTLTTKAIKFQISNLDPRYRYIRVAVLPSTSGTGLLDGVAFIDESIVIPSGGAVVEYLFRGLGFREQEITIEEILVPKVSYSRAKTITQLDNRLILGNVKTEYIDHAEAQKEAIKIVTQYRTTSTPTNNSDMTGMHYFYRKTFMRDEVYAFAIVWVFNDGTESPAYHIPGRPANFPTLLDQVNGTNQFNIVDPHNPEEMGGLFGVSQAAYHNREKATASATPGLGWDLCEYNNAGFNALNTLTMQYNAEHLTTPGSGLLPRWKIFNTAIRNSKWISPSGGQAFRTQGWMSYFESETYIYPDILDCDGNPIYALYDNTGNLLADLSGLPLRHHKMPDTTLEAHYYGFNDRFSPFTTDVTSPVYEPGLPGWQRNTHQTITLGADFTNIQIPLSFVGRVQGFKIVKADRDGEESVLDKGIILYNRQAWTWSNEWDQGFPNTSQQDNKCCSGQGDRECCWFWFQSNDMNKHRWCMAEFGNAIWSECDEEGHNVPSGCSRIGESTTDNGRHTSCARCEFTWWSNGCIPWTRSYTSGNINSYPTCNDLWNVSYHGALTKFRQDVPITPSHIKFEKVYAESTNLWRVRDGRAGHCRDGDAQAYAGHSATVVEYHTHRWPAHNHRNSLIQSGQWNGGFDCPNPTTSLAANGNVSFACWEVGDQPWQNTCWGGDWPGASLTNRDIMSFALVQPGERLEGFLDRPFDNCNSQDTFLLRLNNAWGGVPFPGPENSYPNYGIDTFTNDIDEGGSTVSTDFRRVTAHYVSLKRENPAAYGSLHEIEYVDAQACMSPVLDPTIGYGTEATCGDSFISKMSWRTTYHGRGCCDKGISSWNLASQYSFWTRHSPYYMIESPINSYLRHGTGVGENYYPYHHEGNAPMGTDLYNDYLDQEDLENLGSRGGAYDGVWKSDEAVPNISNDFYGYNLDYSKHNTEKRYFGLPLGFNFCTDCHSEFPTRIVYSEQSFKEERADHFRVFLTNNYSDIPGNRGDIWNLFVSNNVLYAHTEESLWNLFKNQNQLQTEETTIELGTGEFLSRPPRELIETSSGYAGSTSQWSMQVTDYGTFWVDERGGRVFMLKENATEISQMGLRGWFREHLPIEIYTQYRTITGTKFPLIDNPYAPHGAGISSTWDGEYKRYIITKKDYVLTDDAINRMSSAPPTMEMIDGIWYVDDGSGPFSILTIRSRPDLFINKSWTMSYSPLIGGWCSWHSYIPDYYLTSKTHFLSGFNTSSTGEVWKHGLTLAKNNFVTYYDQAYPHILEMVFTKEPLLTDIYDSVNFVTEASLYDTSTDSWVDQELITFDTVIMYNDYQLNPELTLFPKRNDLVNAQVNTVANFPGRILISRDERTWSFNNFRDLVSDETQSLFAEDWINIIGTFNQFGYIDKVPNIAATSTALPWDQQQRFRDKYLIVRFIFSNFVGPGSTQPNCKLITNYTYSQTSLTPR